MSIAVTDFVQCAVDDCDRNAVTRGWCHKHYQRWRKHGDPTIVARPPRRGCDVEDCDRVHYGHGLCSMHHRRWREHGSVELPERTTVSGAAAADLVGVTYRKLDYWLTSYELIGPTVVGTGTGNVREIERSDLPVLHVFAQLVGLGFRPEVAASMSHQLRQRVSAVLRPLLAEAQS